MEVLGQRVVKRAEHRSYLEEALRFAKLSFVTDHLQESADHPELVPVSRLIEESSEQTPTPNNPPWGVRAAVSFWVASVLLIILMPALFLAPYAFTLGTDHPDTETMMKALASDPTAIAIQVLAVIPAHLITILIAWFLVTAGNRYSFFGTLGWDHGGMRWYHYIGIIAGFFALIGLIGYFLPEPEHEMMRILKSSRYAVFLVAFMATFTAPLVEEVVYRGVLYSALQRSVGVGTAVVIVTLLFALVHLPQYYPSLATMIVLVLLSLVLTLMRVRTNSLLPCVILHTIFNAFQAVLLIAEPYLGLEPIVEQTASALQGALP